MVIGFDHSVTEHQDPAIEAHGRISPISSFTSSHFLHHAVPRTAYNGYFYEDLEKTRAPAAFYLAQMWQERPIPAWLGSFHGVLFHTSHSSLQRREHIEPSRRYQKSLLTCRFHVSQQVRLAWYKIIQDDYTINP